MGLPQGERCLVTLLRLPGCCCDSQENKWARLHLEWRTAEAEPIYAQLKAAVCFAPRLTSGSAIPGQSAGDIITTLWEIKEKSGSVSLQPGAWCWFVTGQSISSKPLGRCLIFYSVPIMGGIFEELHTVPNNLCWSWLLIIIQKAHDLLWLLDSHNNWLSC